MKPNFETMTRKLLKSYVFTHRDDREAFDLLMSRRSPDSEAVWHDASTSPAQTKEIFRKKKFRANFKAVFRATWRSLYENC